jgi:hypothetical protein
VVATLAATLHSGRRKLVPGFVFRKRRVRISIRRSDILTSGFSWLFSGSPGKCWNISLKQSTAECFLPHSNSSPTISLPFYAIHRVNIQRLWIACYAVPFILQQVFELATFLDIHTSKLRRRLSFYLSFIPCLIPYLNFLSWLYSITVYLQALYTIKPVRDCQHTLRWHCYSHTKRVNETSNRLCGTAYHTHSLKALNIRSEEPVQLRSVAEYLKKTIRGGIIHSDGLHFSLRLRTSQATQRWRSGKEVPCNRHSH